jgi:F-type H+-transporting ATPase subunit alpha
VLGHVVNGLGYALGDGRDLSNHPEPRPVEIKPLGIADRVKIDRWIESGISVVDLLVPLGYGQRELVIGDRKTGKSHLLLQMLVHQIKQGAIGIYCAIGKQSSEIKQLEDWLRQQGVWERCILVAAIASATPGEIYLAPMTAMTHAEYFRDQGQDVLLILDDLATHARYYREIGLSARQIPGRESYPGDVFHIHAELLERAGNFKVGKKVAAITCLPVCESVAGDFTGYIPTNLMSITDGHWYLDTEIFLEGVRPALNVFLSVTRVGRQTQTKLAREIGEQVLAALKQDEVASRFLQFGSELTPEARGVLDRGTRLKRMFNQIGGLIVPRDLQLLMVTMAWEGIWDGTAVLRWAELYGEGEVWPHRMSHLLATSQTWAELKQTVKKESVWQQWLKIVTPTPVSPKKAR